MAVKRELDIVIGEDGGVSLEAQGFKGKGCEEFTKFLEEALGVVASRNKTSEYYQEEVEQTIKVGSD